MGSDRRSERYRDEDGIAYPEVRDQGLQITGLILHEVSVPRGTRACMAAPVVDKAAVIPGESA